MIRTRLIELTREAIAATQAAGELPPFEFPEIPIDRPQKPELGDYSSPIAMKLASTVRRPPLQIAKAITARIGSHEAISAVEVVPPGFINFRLAPAWLAGQAPRIDREGGQFGNLDIGTGIRVQVEHVSANPTGPLHIGSARNGAIGDTLARVLKAAGFKVETEFYINDAGSQIRHFGESIYSRYAQEAGMDVAFPEDGYQGEYVVGLARDIFGREGRRYLDMPRDQAVNALGRIGTDRVVGDARKTLVRMRIEFDTWFSERSLHDRGLFDQVLNRLTEKGLTYESEGATWFAASKLGVEKDAVLLRSPQVIADPRERPTYLASDVAYVWNKLVDRGYDRAVYVWGADHHGDVPRVQAAARALDLDPNRVAILIYQHVLLKRGGETVHMSKRAGEFVTVDELIDEVGADAVRFLLITRSADSPMDFDLQLAKEQSDENPVYYVQYAHARIASILRRAAEVGVTGDLANFKLLVHPAELDLIRMMLRFEEVVELAATRLEPHHLPHYAMGLAASFHSFYRQCRVLSSDPADSEVSKARLVLVRGAKQVLGRALGMMGVAAPETM